MGKQLFRPDPETDPFHPPAIPTEVHCLHCNKEYESYLIQWEESVDDMGVQRGFWCCPTDGCEGKGFGFDIFPTDPDYIDENGERMFEYDDDEARDGDVLESEPYESASTGEKEEDDIAQIRTVP